MISRRNHGRVVRVTAAWMRGAQDPNASVATDRRGVRPPTRCATPAVTRGPRIARPQNKGELLSKTSSGLSFGSAHRSREREPSMEGTGFSPCITRSARIVCSHADQHLLAPHIFSPLSAALCIELTYVRRRRRVTHNVIEGADLGS